MAARALAAESTAQTPALEAPLDSSAAAQTQEAASLPAKAVADALSAAPAEAPAAPLPAADTSGLLVLDLFQREGRLIDFLREEVAPFSDADIGAAARVVHAGCRKVIDQYFTLEAAMPGEDGTRVTLQAGFDANRVRLTGNVAGQPPFTGTLRHHGWVVTETRLPTRNEGVDTRVIAAAEIEL